ncbi:MAG TPA: CPBP family intramembrane glutamic endopeptidase [Gemmatimonadales bacterium]|nr:CPBP family intramembrane glutamic endopeptidase [Gemmatimonadales bacterium]
MTTGRGGAVAAVGWTIAFLALTWLLTGILVIAAAWLITGSVEDVQAWSNTVTGSSLFVQGIVFLASGLVATWIIGIKAARLDLTKLRWRNAGRPFRGFSWGLLAGAAAAAAALLLAVALTGSGWSHDAGGVGSYLVSLGKTAGALAPAALAEEVAFRGVPLVLLAAAFNRGAALVVIAIVFALGHAPNPHVSGLALGNIALAGIFLGLAFYAAGGLWTAFGAHFGWNLTLAALDAPVSGLPFRIPLLDYHPAAPAWVSGGAFGPEGGLAATAALALASVIVARHLRKDLA